MRRLMAVLSNDFLACMGRPASWGVLMAAVAVALLDSLPVSANLARLDLLVHPEYFSYRIFSVDGLVLVVGLAVLLSGRLAADERSGTKALLMAAPLGKGEYLLGKLASGVLFCLAMTGLYAGLCMAAYAAFIPAGADLASCLQAAARSFAFLGVPVSFFVGACATALPAVVGTRVFYLAFLALVLLSTVTVGSADAMPFYLIASGDLAKLVWQHPDFPFQDAASVAANLAFLVGTGVAATALACLDPRFWRAG